MKKVITKRSLVKLSRLQLVQKPYGFCCEEKDQDPDKYYDMRNPPFVSSLTNVVLDGSGPGVKFRIADIGRPPYSVQLRRILEVKGIAYLGRCKRCRGPLRWHLEDEIALARETMAKERQNDYNESIKRNLKIARQKRRGHKHHIKGTKFQKNTTSELKVAQDDQELTK
ncbi:uncharacterized protein LOC105191636 isoform X2 [Harpegnathos saltator]|uniref:uncharacterized protein LOC105191636 isoform X2 n=1 Tax=Harpegnathos saltator TaxID=610380 RepID=UPI000DBED838|nr:uncharacterized protein LOC105191636 isoform X2 [Harpegnathos saltator]